MDSEYDDSADGAREASVATAGGQLRAAREKMGLDLAHIAAETRIPLRHLESIEQGQFDALPSRAYAIGFSRTYAKAVGLDAAVITDVVRGELADGTMRRSVPSPGMEPGDPARLPSAGLAWAGALAALVLAVGAFAFYNAYFAAGTEPGSLLAPAPTATPTAAAATTPAAEAPAAAGPVVLTALEDGIWVRLYEEGGARLFERTLAKGEAVTVPADATDPRINTGRPDALALTVGGQTVPKLSERAATVSGVPVSASALRARSAPAASASPTAAGSATAAAPVPRPVRFAPAPREAASAPASAPEPQAATADSAEPARN